jgi:hypothetical protein
MFDDIMPVFYLTPEFTNLYAIDYIFDYFHFGTRQNAIDKTKEYITIMLKSAFDIGCEFMDKIRKCHRDGKHQYRTLPDAEPVTSFEVLEENSDDGTIPWRIKFTWKGKERNLIYYFRRNFLNQVWPDEIKELGHIIWNGAYNWQRLARGKDDDNCSALFLEMLSTRSIKPFVYECHSDVDEDFHGVLVDILEIPTGYDFDYIHENEKIARRKVESFEGDWWVRYN